MSWDDIQAAAEAVANELLENAEKVSADSLGLDYRCGRIWVGEDYLAVLANVDRNLQYYGGFEYVGQEYRLQIATVVFYSIEDERVNEHWSQYERKNS